MSTPIDAGVREQALDPNRSFIVQAPAGSGKTELLTRRVLKLLAVVERPEEVLAITFTRKAAAGMRHRVIAALQRAQDPAPARDDHERDGIELAQRVLARDAAQGWNLVDDPERLGMRTIDSLAAQFAHRLPMLSGLGAPMRVADDAQALYHTAAERFLDQHIGLIEGISQKLDNRVNILRGLLVDLLAIRDQWGSYVTDDFTDQKLRDVLESMLAALLRARVAALRKAMPKGLVTSLTPLVTRAAGYISALAESGDLELENDHRGVLQLSEALAELGGSLPGDDLDALPVWCLIADCLLTAVGTLRKSLNIKQGFPAQTAHQALGVSKPELKAHKDGMLELLRGLDGELQLLTLLNEVRKLPPPGYSDEEWELLGQLGKGLPLLQLELQLVFAERRELDFVEVAKRAVQALGEELAPTDLALAMDLRIKHILVDEFQDTSRAQFELFKRLVAEWGEGEGRSFFAVGDPMQSIYRFREGDVGLFLRAVKEGIGPLALEPLKLEVNFRSSPVVIDWVNAQFSQAFPSEADPDIGAVTYEPSTAHRSEVGAVDVHVLDRAAEEDVKVAEGERVAELVQQALADDDAGDVGILLRARSHAPEIVAALQARGIAFRAIELERLGDRPVVRDLVALALALRYPHDRTSWLSVLRGPLCGLSLSDLHALCADSEGASLPDLMQDSERLERLDEDGKQRVQRFCAEALPAIDRAPRTTLLPWVEALWLRLGGAAVCHGAVDKDAVERALVRLAELEKVHGLWQRASVESAMGQLFAGESTHADAHRVQLMTLHKSKGLEFDTVILPALGRIGGANKSRLFDWYQSSIGGKSSLLLAPIDRANIPDHQRSPIGKLLRRFRSAADAAEQLRLLYVACTRARRQLHLVASLKFDDDGLPKAESRALLAPIWPTLREQHSREPVAVVNERDANVDTDANIDKWAEDVDASIPRHQAFVRPTTEWQLPEFTPFAWTLPPPASTETRPVEYDWQGSTARDVGTVVHRELQRLAELPEKHRSAPDSTAIERIARELRTLAVTEADLDKATAQVVRALGNTLDDERGCWTLHDHSQARSEWALSVPTLVDGRVTRVQRVIIDRSFIDEDGTRWIIDYKTSSHEGGGLDEFLDREVERYREQLDTYAAILKRIEPERPARLGLWFPMVRGWREIDAQSQG